MYLGSNFVLNYIFVDDIVTKTIDLGPGSLIYKVDISLALRQLKVDWTFWALNIIFISLLKLSHLDTDMVQFS